MSSLATLVSSSASHPWPFQLLDCTPMIGQKGLGEVGGWEMPPFL
jgi:hypothetical protein